MKRSFDVIKLFASCNFFPVSSCIGTVQLHRNPCPNMSQHLPCWSLMNAYLRLIHGGGGKRNWFNYDSLVLLFAPRCGWCCINGNTTVMSPMSTWEQAWDELDEGRCLCLTVSQKHSSASSKDRLFLRSLEKAVNIENKSQKTRKISGHLSPHHHHLEILTVCPPRPGWTAHPKLAKDCIILLNSKSVIRQICILTNCTPESTASS